MFPKILLVPALVFCLALSACGSSSSSSSSSPQNQVKGAMTSFAQAAQDKDAAKFCSYITPKAQKGLLSLTQDKSCTTAAAKIIPSFKKAEIATTLKNIPAAKVTINGDTATVVVKGDTAPAKLLKVDGKWLVNIQ